jgi:hypothetical protein
MTAKESHTTFGNNSLRCLNCGDEYHIDMSGGLSLNMMAGLARGFDDDHRKCKPSARGRSRFEYKTETEWLASWDTGMSSLEIFHFMTGGIYGAVRGARAIPRDPADFGRCYRLLKAFPHWRERLVDMGLNVPGWADLAIAWPTLEALFEEESPSGQCPKLFAALNEINHAAHRQEIHR